jgi:hypothetical protein
LVAYARSAVRAHIFLYLLAYYVEWHTREAWRELMFADANQQAKAVRDPVAPARRSKAALAKAARHTLDNGTPVHSFATLIAELATIARNTCRTPMLALMRQCSRFSPRPTRRNSARSNCSSRSADPAVDRNRNPFFRPSACHAMTNSVGPWRNFGLD